MPTVDLPGMRSIRMDSAFSARHRSSAKSRDAAVFDARLGFEFVGGDHRSRIDLRDVPADVEFPALLFDGARALLQFVFLYFFAALGHAQQAQAMAVGSWSCRANLGFSARVSFPDGPGRACFRVNQHGAGRRASRPLSLGLFFFRLSSAAGGFPLQHLRGTGWRPAVLLISTAGVAVACSRASRQATQRALSLP